MSEYVSFYELCEGLDNHYYNDDTQSKMVDEYLRLNAKAAKEDIRVHDVWKLMDDNGYLFIVTRVTQLLVSGILIKNMISAIETRILIERLQYPNYKIHSYDGTFTI